MKTILGIPPVSGRITADHLQSTIARIKARHNI